MLKLIAPAAGLVLLTLLNPGKNAVTPAANAPAYAANGNLVVPENYREWVFLTSGIDMTYVAASAPPDHHMFENVFVNPDSYRAFLATGTWPDKTTFILEIRGADDPVSINKRGHTQSTGVMGMEIHVKDAGKWSFYDRKDGAKTADLLPPKADCYTCHEAHAAVDTTFVQFYPMLLPIAQTKGTLSPAYLKETAQPTK